jgi:hypothetical protein
LPHSEAFRTNGNIMQLPAVLQQESLTRLVHAVSKTISVKEKSYIACITCAVVATCAVGTSTTAFAAPTRLLGVYEESVGPLSCNDISVCRINFSTITKPLKINKVSCNYFFNRPAFFTGMNLGNSSGDQSTFKSGQFLGPIHEFRRSATLVQGQLLADTAHVVPTNFRPSVLMAISMAADIVLQCHISGQETE